MIRKTSEHGNLYEMGYLIWVLPQFVLATRILSGNVSPKQNPRIRCKWCSFTTKNLVFLKAPNYFETSFCPTDSSEHQDDDILTWLTQQVIPCTRKFVHCGFLNSLNPLKALSFLGGPKTFCLDLDIWNYETLQFILIRCSLFQVCVYIYICISNFLRLNHLFFHPF